MTPQQQLDTAGYLITPPLLDDAELAAIDQQLNKIPTTGAGQRNLMRQEWCAALGHQLSAHAALAELLPPDAIAVQCTYFQKSSENNWLVSLHQDLSIPVAERVTHPELTTWSTKDAQLYAQPPAAALAQLLAVRLHLDPCGEHDGALRIIPGSHRSGKLDADTIQHLRNSEEQITCVISSGSALAMRPLLLHASSKATGTSRRRVLHFLFAPSTLPYGLRWPESTFTELTMDHHVQP